MNVRLIIFVLLMFWGCSQPQARRPITHNKGKNIKASVERNKAIIRQQQKQIQAIVEQDTLLNFQSDPAGFWYAIQRQQRDQPRVEAGDEIEFLYRIQTLEGTVIYDEMELGKVNYLVDKEDLLPALRQGVKKLRQHEIGVFLMPSFLAYSYQGDEDKIEINQPLRFTIEIKNILKKNTTLKSE